jgi:hypothetical protein
VTELPNFYGGRTGQLGSNHRVAAVADDNNDNHLLSAHIMSSWFLLFLIIHKNHVKNTNKTENPLTLS